MLFSYKTKSSELNWSGGNFKKCHLKCDQCNQINLHLRHDADIVDLEKEGHFNIYRTTASTYTVDTSHLSERLLIFNNLPECMHNRIKLWAESISKITQLEKATALFANHTDNDPNLIYIVRYTITNASSGGWLSRLRSSDKIKHVMFESYQGEFVVDSL